MKKHDEIRVLAMSKLNTIEDLISAAINDGKISHVEFQLINNELTKFHEMINSLKRKYKSKEVKGVSETELERRIAERVAQEKNQLIAKLMKSYLPST